MKTILPSLSAAILLTVSAPAGPEWHDNVAAARELAAKEQKDLLLQFTGSDWCEWCRKLKEEVSEQEVFQRGVADRFVLVTLDFPKDASLLSAATRAQNEGMKRDYGVRGYPTVVLCDAEGRPYAQSGYQAGGAEAFLKHVEESRARRAQRDASFAKAAAAEGAERAAALEAALAHVPRETLGTIYAREFEELASLNAGSALVSGTRSAARAEETRAQFRDFFTRQDFEGALTHADALLGEGKLDGDQKRQVLLYKLNAFVALDRHEDALAVGSQIKEVAPDRPVGSGVDRLLQHLEELRAKGKARGEDGEPVEDGARKEKEGPSGFHLPGGPARWWIAAEEPAAEEPPAAEKPAPEKPGVAEEAEAGDEATQREALAQAKRELAAVKERVDAVHARREMLVPKLEASKARVMELRKLLADEEAALADMVDELATLEQGHNADHERQAALEKELGERSAALEQFDGGQDDLTKLEKRAAALREEAARLRRRAEELKED